MDLGISMRRRQLALVAALLLAPGLTAVVVTQAIGGAPGDGDVAARCDRAAVRAAQRRALDTGLGAGLGVDVGLGAGPDVVVIGDSYSVGAGVELMQSWPTRLPGRVHVDGFSGSGFSDDASPCGAVSYADRAARAVAGHPDALVVVEGGLNDHDRSDAEIEAGFTRLMGELAGREVLVVGPASAPSRVDDVPRIDAVLARLSAAFGASYLSVADADLDYLPGDLHPTAGGQRKFGDRVARAISAWIYQPQKRRWSR